MIHRTVLFKRFKYSYYENKIYYNKFRNLPFSEEESHQPKPPY